MVGISKDPLSQPDKFRTYTTSSIPLIFDSLSQGAYYVFVQSSGADCSIGQGPYTIGGAYAIDFDMVPHCAGTDLSFSLVNITGNPDEDLEVRIYRKFTNVQEPSVIISPFPVTGSYFFSKADRAFLRNPDEYLIEIVQFDEDGECFEIHSELKEYKVPYPLDAEVGEVKESYPDIATGELNLQRFTGGVMPYDVRIELDSASSLAFPEHATDFERVELNSEQQLVSKFDNVPPGRYTVQIEDSVGCTLELTARVPMDLDIFIPNVMTPNDDGVNDVFFIRNLSQSGVNKLVITNRWGKEVYSSNSYNNTWKGENAVDGVYFYRLQVNDSAPITGWVEIMRGIKP
jgi:gliding motility-associated-like protein